MVCFFYFSKHAWYFLTVLRQWGTKLLEQLTRYELISPTFPPSNVVVCAELYTLACPESFHHPNIV